MSEENKQFEEEIKQDETTEPVAEKVDETTPETEEVVAVIAVGYRTEDVDRPKRKDFERIAKFF